ncbi:MAG: multicopper oxidase domain-containing protein [Actinobacteria bacterium]|nr:multicopper oxidase domain-containing protein [Actinomycetota bacterium]
MSSYRASKHHRPPPVETESAVVAKVGALLLGLLVAVLGVFSLLMWTDARESRDAAAQPAAAQSVATDHNVALPLASFAGVVPENAAELAEAHKAYDATLPPVPAGDLVKVQMTLKDLTVEIAPGVKYNTWAFDGHGAPGPIINVREGQTVEMTLTNGGAIPHSIDFHAARIAPNVAFKDVAPGDSITFRFTASDPGVYMYHCGTKPVLAHIANGMYGAIIIPAEAGPAEGRQRVCPRRQRVVPERRRDQGAGLARLRQGPRQAVRLGHVQRLCEPVRHPPAHREAGRDDALLGRRGRADEQRQLPRRRRDARPRLGQRRSDEPAVEERADGDRAGRRRRRLRRQARRRGPLSVCQPRLRRRRSRPGRAAQGRQSKGDDVALGPTRCPSRAALAQARSGRAPHGSAGVASA